MTNAFAALGLPEPLTRAVADMGYENPTPIQVKAIPELLKGRDVLAAAQTGTGKTAAFSLPILTAMLAAPKKRTPKHVRALILAPTRELAAQIDENLKAYAANTTLKTALVFGGVGINPQIQALSRGVDFLVATPGRLLDHLGQKTVSLEDVEFLVLDEADRMLDMGFSEDIKTIAAKLPKSCQTIMFSATMPEKIEELAKTLLKNPVEIKLAVSKPAEKIKQKAYVCYETQKMDIIKDIFKAGDLQRVIIFCGSKMKVKQVAGSLQRKHINCGEMHSDLEQAERDNIMFKFKSGQIDVLVATDIVARGIDIDDIALVINYDVPHDTEDYVHRIGRTARADRDGVAITFVSEEDIFYFQQIEKFLEKEVEKVALPEGCGEAPVYTKQTKPHKAGNNSAKSRRRKNREQTAHKRKPNNKTATRQEKAPRTENDKPENGNKPENNNNPENSSRKEGQQQNKGNRNNRRKGNNRSTQEQTEGKQCNRQPQTGNKTNNKVDYKADNKAENRDSNAKRRNVRPGSNGRGRGVSQKKTAEKPATRKVTPIVNPQKKENVVKKIFKRIFGFKK